MVGFLELAVLYTLVSLIVISIVVISIVVISGIIFLAVNVLELVVKFLCQRCKRIYFKIRDNYIGGMKN